MSISSLLSKLALFLTDQPAAKQALRFFQKIFRPKKDIRVRIGKHVMYANTFDRIIALYLRKFSLSESLETKLFMALVKKGMNVVDVGANLGYYTLVAADLVGAKGQVFAFEPDPENFSLLEKNIKSNNYFNAKALRFAVSSKPGAVKLFLCEEHRGNHRTFDSQDERKTIEVRATSLNYFFKPSFRIDVIKIDVEGAEAMVFEGITRIIRENPNIIIFTEFWPKALEISGHSPRDLLTKIKNQGLSIYVINEEKNKVELTSEDDVLSRCRGRNYLNLFLKKCMP